MCIFKMSTLFEKRLFSYIISALVLILVFFGFTPTASAILRQHQEVPGVMRYHSQASIKDETGHAWQIVLYKVKNPDAFEDINIRLIGFPGVVEFTHPDALEIVTRKGKLLSASDVYAENSPAPNVGEYKFTNILSQLPTTDSLKLNLPLKNDSPQSLKIPKSVINEWQMLVTEFD
jgi:Protein of unknown function (DUF3122)